jgi:predicted DNA-binding transcriptional regulator AlpA
MRNRRQDNIEEGSDLLTIPQAAAILGPVGKPLSRETMDRMIRAGAFPITRSTGHPNGRVTIQRKYVLAHLEANTTLAVAA